MSQKAARGTKRTCRSCGSRFYDLNRDPIACPICGAEHVQETSSGRGGPAAGEEPVARPARVPVAKEASPPVAGEDMPEVVADDLADIEADDAEISNDEEDTFLAEEEEEDSDVADFIDGPVDGDEEES
ncbi:MAG: TIGR02300 family protein [Hyphomicrobiaceae bacterium]